MFLYKMLIVWPEILIKFFSDLLRMSDWTSQGRLLHICNVNFGPPLNIQELVILFRFVFINPKTSPKACCCKFATIWVAIYSEFLHIFSDFVHIKAGCCWFATIWNYGIDSIKKKKSERVIGRPERYYKWGQALGGIISRVRP